MLKKDNFVYYLFLLFLTYTPFIVYTNMFLCIEIFIVFLWIIFNKRLILIKKHSLINLFYIIPIVALLSGKSNATAIGFSLKFLMGIIIIIQFNTVKFIFITKKYFDYLCKILIGSIFLEMLFPSIFFSLLSPIFNIMIGSEGSSMIYSNAFKGIFYGIFPDATTTTGILILNLVFLSNKYKYMIKDYIFIFLIFFCLILTSKRGPLMFAFITFIYSYCLNKYNNINVKRIIMVIFYLFIAIFIIIIIFPSLNTESGLGRLINTIINFNSNDMDVTSGRKDLSEFALSLFYNNKLFGIGWANFSIYYKEATYLDVLNVHNVFIQLLCEVGMIGTIITLLPFFKALKNLMSIDSTDDDLVYIKKVALSLLVFNILYMFTGCFFNMPFYYLSLLLLINFADIRSVDNA